MKRLEGRAACDQVISSSRAPPYMPTARLPVYMHAWRGLSVEH